MIATHQLIYQAHCSMTADAMRKLWLDLKPVRRCRQTLLFPSNVLVSVLPVKHRGCAAAPFGTASVLVHSEGLVLMSGRFAHLYPQVILDMKKCILP